MTHPDDAATTQTRVETVRALVAALPDAMIVIDDEQRVLAANDAATTLFPPLRLEAPLALWLRDPDLIDAVSRVHGGGAAETVVWRERAPLERQFEARVGVLQLGQQRALVIALRDLTEGLRLERMRVDFVANASHELRTPLASLLGFVETLQGAARDDMAAREKFLAIMREQARRMARLIEDLLSLSRIEQNQHVRPRARVDLVAVLRHVMETLTPKAREAGMTIVLDAPAAADTIGDRDELIRVAENLIENAIKYGGEGADSGRIDVRVVVERDAVVFSVRDYGRGVEAHHLPRLTERFYRVDATTSRARGGTGLGLAIVKHIVLRHRGDLRIESAPGEGASFTVRLPRAPDA